jgi:RHS repeat-associated protein
VVDDNGNQRHFEYDTANRLRAVTDAKENKVICSYDENSNLISIMEVEKSDLASPDETFVTSYQYDNLDRLVMVIDNNDNTSEHAYDSRSNPTLRTDALNHQTRYTYDGLGRLISTVRDLDGDGPDGEGSDVTTTQAWDDSSQLVGQTDDNGNTTLYEWDPVVASRLYEHWFRASGGSWGRVSSGVWGSRVSAGGWGGRVSGGGWDRVSSGAWGRVSAGGWDRVSSGVWGGRVSGGVWGRLVKTTYADSTVAENVYDVHDNITQSTDANGSEVKYTYDLLNRVTAKTITPGPGVSSDTTFENYKYDGMSRVVYAEDDDSVVTLAYDSLSNVTAETLNGQTTTSVHDGLGNKLSCTYPGGRVVSCTYDELNRKSVVWDASPTGRYDYIGPVRVERLSFGNNIWCDFAYDNVKRITSTKHSDSAGGIIDQRTYRWGKMYNKTQRKDVRTGGPELTHDYSYDAVNRLIQTTVTNAVAVVRETDYSLDGVGNRTEVTGSPDPGSYTMDSNTPEPADYQMNQYTTTPFDSRSYDKNGNLVTIDDGERTQKDIRYDYRNQIVEFTETSTGQVHRYRYDAFGRRTERVVDSTGSAQTTRYLYDGFKVIEEQDGSSNTQATYIYGNYIDEVLNMQRNTNDYYYHHDELYNVMAVTNANGLVVERYEYLDYGEPSFFDSSGSPIGDSAIGNPYLFTGRRYDPESGLYYYRTRYLDPVAGRFTSRDTIGIWGDLGNLGNGTAYVGNRSPTDNDPSGRWGEHIGCGI